MDTETVRPRRSLEELVDRLMDALFKVEPEPSAVRGRRDACGRGGPGDALATRQGRLGAQPAGSEAPDGGA